MPANSNQSDIGILLKPLLFVCLKLRIVIAPHNFYIHFEAPGAPAQANRGPIDWLDDEWQIVEISLHRVVVLNSCGYEEVLGSATAPVKRVTPDPKKVEDGSITTISRESPLAAPL